MSADNSVHEVVTPFAELSLDDREVIESFAALPTEDDLPCDDGEPMETQRHWEQMILLIESLKTYWRGTKRYYVAGNMFLHYDPENLTRFRGPDVFLVLDVDYRERKSWVVWQEGMRYPDLIIELLSDSTRHVDKGVKKELYSRVFHTPEYYLYDPFSLEFQGFRYEDDQYEPVVPDGENKIHSPATGLYLAVRDDRLRWLSEHGEILPTNAELRDRETRRAERETRRAEWESRRAEREYQRAEQEKQRARNAEELLEAYRRRFGDI